MQTQENLLTTVPVEALASFVSRLVSQRFVSDPRIPAEETSEQVTAALLQCDLSGFTTLTEDLARRGPAGAEELSRSLSLVFGRLTDLVALHGGDVVKFAGDSLLVSWPVVAEGDSPTRDLSVAARRAAQCGLGMQELLEADPVAAKYGLAMRAGVGVGEFTALQLGGLAERWDLALVGEPLAQVGAAQTESAIGKVTLSPQAWHALGGAGTDPSGREVWAGTGSITLDLFEPVPPRPLERLTLPPEAGTALWSFIPAAARTRLLAGQADWIGELRRLTVVFVDLPALTAGPAPAEAQKMIRELQDVLYHYEGSFVTLSVDEKGMKLLAVFGLPPMAHEDDPVRAVLAARQMLERLTRLGVECSIGVTTGRAFCGVLGGESRREYGVMGEVVNLSARLMQLAQGGILCDEETHNASQLRLAFRASRPIAIKGKAEPVIAYSPSGEHGDATGMPVAMPGNSSPMVGRSAESDELSKALAALLDGHGDVMAIEGEAGIGKSRLVEHLLTEAASRGVRSLLGTGNAIETTSPYGAWRPILGQLLGLDRLPRDREAQRNHVVEVLGTDPQLADLIPLIDAILPLGIPDNDLTRTMDADVRADNIQQLVTRLVQSAAATGPLLMVFDDAHWLDSSSWQLARLVIQNVRPLAVVVAMRPFEGPPPSEYQAFLASCSPRPLALGPLAATDISALVCKTLGLEELPEEVTDLLLDKAEGHPLFSKELAYFLRNEKLLVTIPPAGPGRLPRGRLAPGAKLSEVVFPESVQVLVTSRIDKLEAGQQLLLKVASVIGRVFGANALRDVLPVQSMPVGFTADLKRLEEAGLITTETPGPNATYRFNHSIIQEVAYGLLLYAHRQELHRAVALWYESTHGEELERYLPVLAHHWTLAEDVPQAVHYQGLAGEQALRNFANEEAITFLGRALELSDAAGHAIDRVVRARWELDLGEAYVHWSRYPEGRRHLEQGLALLGQPVPKPASGAHRAWGFSRAVGRQWRHRLIATRPSVTDPGQRAELLLASRAYTRLVEAAFLSGDQWLALYSSFHALNLAEETAPSPELAEAYGPVGVIYGAIPWRSAAGLYLDRALRTARQVESPSALGYALLAYSTYAVGNADWERAESMSGELVELGRRIGARKRLNDGLQLLTCAGYSQGRFEACIATADELLSSASRGRDPRFSAYGYFAKAYGTLYLGHPDQALGLMGQIPDLLGSQSVTTDRQLELMNLGLMAAAYFRLGRADEAMEAAIAAQQRQAGAPLDLGYSLPGYSLTAEVLLGLWESGHPDPSLPEKAKQACQSLKRFARLYTSGRPYAHLCLGRYAWLSDKPGRAARHWRAAVTSAEELGMPLVAAAGHLELTRCFADGSPDRGEHAQLASEIFDQLHTPHEYASALAVLKGADDGT